MTDKIAKELLEKAGKDSTDREKAYTLFAYMGDNFYYDYDQQEKREPFTKIINEGRNGFICTDYAMMTYLIANKMGIPCELVLGTDHIYNTMKIDGQWLYCDLSGTKYGFVESETYNTAESYKINESTAEGKNALAGNAGKTGSTVSAFESIRQAMYYIIHGESIGNDIVAERMLNIGIVGIAAVAISSIILIAIVRHIKAVRKAHRRARK